MGIITCGVTMLISWNSLCSRGHGKIFQFDGVRMLDVQISETLAGISFIVGSVGTWRWIGGARHYSRQRCSVHGSTVRVGRVRTVKKSFRKIIIFQNGLIHRTLIRKILICDLLHRVNMKIVGAIGLLDGTGTLELIVVASRWCGHLGDFSRIRSFRRNHD